MRTFIQYAFYPIILGLVFLGCYLGLRWFSKAELIYVPGLCLLFTLPLMITGEFLLMYRKDWDEAKGEFWSDFFSSLVVLPTASKLAEFLIPVLFFYPVIWLVNHDWISLTKYEFSFGVELLLAILASEFFYYWTHRAFHKLKFLWRFHSIHHGAERVYWMNSGRFHFIEAFISGFFYFFPLVILGVSEDVLICVVSISGVTGFVEHINVDFKAGFLNYVFNTAQHHRWHHSIIEKESNRNYGKTLILWDLLFGTFYLPRNKEVEEVGVDENVPHNVVRQFVYPFRKMPTGE